MRDNQRNPGLRFARRSWKLSPTQHPPKNPHHNKSTAAEHYHYSAGRRTCNQEVMHRTSPGMFVSALGIVHLISPEWLEEMVKFPSFLTLVDGICCCNLC